jgi:hypothetical protein
MCKKKISAEDSFRTTALPANVATVSKGTRVSVLSPEDSRFTSVPSPFFLYSPLPTIKNSKTMSPDCTVQVNRPLPYSGTEKSVALAIKTGVKICISSSLCIMHTALMCIMYLYLNTRIHNIHTWSHHVRSQWTRLLATEIANCYSTSWKKSVKYNCWKWSAACKYWNINNVV